MNGNGTGGTAAHSATAGTMPIGGAAATGSGGENAGATSSQAGVGSGGVGAAGTTGGAGGTNVTGGAGGLDASTTGGSGGSSGSGSDAGTLQPLAERVCPAGESFGAPLPVDTNARVATLVQGGFGFLEGPVWIAEQSSLLFTDMNMGAPSSASGPPARIRRLMPPSTFDVWVEQANSNGLALDSHADVNGGHVLACSHDVQSLSRFDVDTKVRTPLALLYLGDHFNSPNDLTVRSDGTVYFTDPDWQLGSRSSETGITGVYRVTPAGNVELVTSALSKPNGIALSPDESTLYIGSSGSDIMSAPVNADGSVGELTVFVSLNGGADGFAIDCAGNLYVTTGGAVRVFSPTKQDLGSISVGATPSNAAFGGADRKTLYITAGSGLYSIALAVPGLPY